jgi:hypothetical protein
MRGRPRRVAKRAAFNIRYASGAIIVGLGYYNGPDLVAERLQLITMILFCANDNFWNTSRRGTPSTLSMTRYGLIAHVPRTSDKGMFVRAGINRIH